MRDNHRLELTIRRIFVSETFGLIFGREEWDGVCISVVNISQNGRNSNVCLLFKFELNWELITAISKR